MSARTIFLTILLVCPFVVSSTNAQDKIRIMKSADTLRTIGMPDSSRKKIEEINLDFKRRLKVINTDSTTSVKQKRAAIILLLKEKHHLLKRYPSAAKLKKPNK